MARSDKQQRVTNAVDMQRATFERAIRLLTVKPRSVAELRERLLQTRHTDQNTVDKVISRLSEYGYLDDERFAFSYASLKIKQKPMGRRRLERDLTLKKVSTGTTVEALDLVYGETSEEHLIQQAIEKRIRLRGRPKDRIEAKKLFDHLLRRGFGFELVSEKVKALLKDPDDL